MSVKASLNSLLLVVVKLRTPGPTITLLDTKLLSRFFALKGNLINVS